MRHVIQAEFATNVVQYLHRIGRASRAGRAGKATNFYDESSADLVNSILASQQPSTGGVGDSDGDHSGTRGDSNSANGANSRSGDLVNPDFDGGNVNGIVEVEEVDELALLMEAEEIEGEYNGGSQSPSSPRTRNELTDRKPSGHSTDSSEQLPPRLQQVREREREPVVLEPGRIDASFSRRRGFRQKLKRAKAAALPIEDSSR